MAFFTSAFLDARRQNWLDQIHSCQYRIGDTWHDAVISTRDIVGGSVIVMATVTDPVGEIATIAESRLIDIGGNVAGSRVETIEKSANHGVLLKFEFPINEV